jgi:carboxyl-terminal processing protease
MRKIFITLVFFVFALFAKGESNAFLFSKNIDIFFSILQELDLHYVDTIDYQRVMKRTIGDMLNTMDPYTVYISEEESADFDFSTTGQYGGIGAIIHKKGTFAEIAESYQNSPADKAGLKAGDLILEIDGFPLNDKNIADVSASLKGKPTTALILKVLKLKEKDTVTLSIKREQIQLPSVPYYSLLDGKVGYICFSTFTKDCSNEVRSALIDLKKKGAKSIILDLRNNTGGLLEEAIKVVNLFVPKGQVVVSMKGRVGGEKSFKTENSPVDTQIPLVVLINPFSASSSEIVAGALQDLDRAVLIGQKSFGKGLVQNISNLPYNTRLKFTTAKYYTPSNRCVQAIDYSHRTKDGKANVVPDSLYKSFKTRAGRLVHDAGGITPDESITPIATPKILISLYEKNLLFDFANEFYIKNTTIDSLEKFMLKDADYDNFIAFAEERKFSYRSSSEDAVQELIKILQKEKRYGALQPIVDTLSARVTQQHHDDFLRFKKEISQVLEEEIAARYYYQAGRLAVSVKQDDVVKRGVKILSDNKLYNSFLTPTSDD